MDRAGAIAVGIGAGWFVLLMVLFLSPVQTPPVDRGHECSIDRWGCRP